MRSSTFAGHLAKAFNETHGSVAAVVTVFGSFATYFITPDNHFLFAAVALAATVFLYTVVWLLWSSFTAFRDARPSLPSVRHARPDYQTDASNTVLLLLDGSEWFSHGTIVSIFLVVEDMEVLIGNGAVVNIQDNGFIQVRASNRIADRGF